MKTKNGKAKKRFVCPREQKSNKRGINVKGKWKAVELDPSLFSEEGLEGLVCFEELTNYSLIDTEKAAANAEKALKQEEKRAKKRKASEGEEAGGESTAEPAKKKPKKKKKKKKVTANQSDNVSPEEEKQESKASDEVVNDDAAKDSTPVSDLKVKSKNKNKKKKKKPKQEKDKSAEPEKQVNVEPSSEQVTVESPSEQTAPGDEKSNEVVISKPPMKQVKNWTNAALCGSTDKNADVSAWKELFVPPPVLKALGSLGFASPTPIQALALPSAIRDRMDILGAAETGSGKTLAFGIPMIHSILEWKKCPEKTADGDGEPSVKVESLYLPSVEKATIDAEQEDEMEASEQEDGNAGDQIQEDVTEERDDDEQLDSAKVEFDFKENDAGDHNQPLLGLVLTPTRELAVQVKHHIDAIAKFTGIKTAIVVGGMAQQKQRRMLKRRPEIIIATPGRLWDLVKEKDPHLVNLRQLRCLVIDEADRMVERGHFAELENLLEMLNSTHFNPTRQMFVFSATLTMTHSLPSRLMKKKRSVDQRNKLEVLMEKVGIKSKPKVIDLTRKEATVESLTETQIHCQKEEKDFYLYYFLLQYPGRTMVFANSIDCIKRLNSLLVILDCTPLPLHANMHQKQRLKNLERFAERGSCVLLTTDVAARGLDIPDVQHVIHYQVPRTSETYVHRSGRTARATKEGLSLLLIGPDDMMNFQKIYKTLGKDEELPMFPVETKCMKAIEERVKLAHSIEKMEYFNSREKKHNSWFKRAAEALELDLDDDLLLGGEKDEVADREQQKKVKGMKKHLKHLISQPIFKNMLKTKYPTQMGKLPLPSIPLSKKESALTSVSKEGKKKKFKKSVKPQQKKQQK